MPETNTIPTLHEWADDPPALEHLADYFFARIQRDETLEPLFANMPGDHRQHVADFVAEVFGYQNAMEQLHADHAHVVVRHVGRFLTLQQRRSWMDLFLDSVDALGLPRDPQVTFALVEYLEWGSRSAVEVPYRRMMVC